MRIKKTSQYIEGGASLSNVYGTSNENGYTQEYINKQNEYSTDEIDTGKKWIDGKKIYRKVYSITNPSSSNTNYHDVSSLNIETLVNIKAPIINSNIGYFVAPFQDSTDNYAILFVNSANYLRGRFGTAIISGFVSCKVILEYTKTTD